MKNKETPFIPKKHEIVSTKEQKIFKYEIYQNKAKNTTDRVLTIL